MQAYISWLARSIGLCLRLACVLQVAPFELLLRIPQKQLIVLPSGGNGLNGAQEVTGAQQILQTAQRY